MKRKSRCHRFQFSLKTLLLIVTVAAVATALWNHGRICLLRATAQEYKGHKLRSEAYIVLKHDIVCSKALHELGDLHFAQANQYRNAIWKPWIRLSIQELPSAPAVSDADGLHESEQLQIPQTWIELENIIDTMLKK